MGKSHCALFLPLAVTMSFSIFGSIGVCLGNSLAITFPVQDYLFIGRFDYSDPAGPKFAWSASTIKACFQGTEVSINLKSNGDNWFNVIIDGSVMKPINVKPGDIKPITLASKLPYGTHTVELVKRTEAFVGEVQFLGFTFGKGNILTPPTQSARRIEFIGDSITCGYGNEGSDQYQKYTTENENAYLAYGTLAARALDADQITVAWSGKGITRNYEGDKTDLLPEVYLRILPFNKNLLWDPNQWIPQLVVINLGTNDFGLGVPNQAGFNSAYINLIKHIREQYPDAHIYCALGPVLGGYNLKMAREFIASVVRRFDSSGDPNVHFIEFPPQDGSNGYGEDWHPSAKIHQLMADQLVRQLKADLDW